MVQFRYFNTDTGLRGFLRAGGEGGGGKGEVEIKQKKNVLFMVSLNMIYFVLFPQASEPNIISLWSVLFWKNNFCRN